MTKRVIQIPTFNPKQTLKSIREDSLNPVIERVLQVEGNIEGTIAPTQQTVYNKVEFSESTKELTFTPVGNTADPVKHPIKKINLTSIVPVQAGIDIKGYKVDPETIGSGSVSNISKVKFRNATVERDDTDGYAKVDFEWDKIVPQNQTPSTVTLSGLSQNLKYTNIRILGTGERYFTHTPSSEGGVLTITMPLVPSQMIATVTDASTTVVDVPINKIHLTGNVGGSTVNGDVLQIDMPSGGGTFTVGYFKGFYNAVEEIDSEGLVSDRSSAYIKTEIQGATVYTLYMYKGPTDKWKAVLNSPPLLFNSTIKQAIFSVKENSDISVGSDGVLNLDGLMNHIDDAKGYIGIFESEEKLNAFPDPVQDKSLALVRDDTLGVFKSYTYRIGKDPVGAVAWEPTPVEGSLKFVTAGTTVPEYKPVYGVNSSPGVSLGSDGMITITPPKKGNIQVKAKDSEDHLEQTKTVKGIHFVDGIYVDLVSEEDWAVVKHPQRVVTYNDEFETKHKSSSFMGNLFFDTTTSSWIGWSEGKDGGVDTTPKWTRVAHRDMSDQVLSLDSRYPKENTPLVPTSEDDKSWEVSGTTYLEKDNENLPSNIKDVCGGFIKTEVKAVAVTNPPATPDIRNQTRIQTCFADDGSGKTSMRAYDTVNKKWKDWVNTSSDSSALIQHNLDPKAHFSIMKYHKVIALKGKLSTIFNQTETGQSATGALKAKNGSLLLDSHGHTQIDQNYITVPYKGSYRILGVLNFSGYTEKTKDFPTGVWQVVLRAKNTAGGYSPIGQFTYTHADKASKYPNLSFEVTNKSLDIEDKIITNITFSDSKGLKEKHPNLYLAPIRSCFVVEDMVTVAGSRIAESYRSLFSHVDPFGNVGIKVHHAKVADLSSKIRIYGEDIDMDTTEMQKISL